MATYETRLRETRRFEAIDAEGRPQTVVEHCASLHRVSLRTKPFEPVDGGRRYSLADGRELVRKGSGLETVDGKVRLFDPDLPDDTADAPIGATPAAGHAPVRGVKGRLG